MSSQTTEIETCYRHPGRETRVSCSSCGRPICPDCMTPSPVGMRCPECARQRTKVKSMPTRSTTSGTTATVVLIAACVVLFLASGQLSFGGGGGDALFRRLALFGPLVADGEWYRLGSYGFLHSGILHIAFNMYLLWILGQMLEPALGTPRFVAAYVASLFAGAVGALILDPNAVTVGASGAIFGLMGLALIELHRRGINPLTTGIGGLVVFNLVLSLIIPNVSIGGHVGGLVGGVLVGLVYRFADEARQPRLALVGAVVLAAGAFVAGIAIA